MEHHPVQTINNPGQANQLTIRRASSFLHAHWDKYTNARIVITADSDAVINCFQIGKKGGEETLDSEICELAGGKKQSFLTEYFTILVPQNPPIRKFHVVQKRISTYLKL